MCRALRPTNACDHANVHLTARTQCGALRMHPVSMSSITCELPGVGDMEDADTDVDVGVGVDVDMSVDVDVVNRVRVESGLAW